MNRKRPIGIKIISMVELIIGIIGIIYSLLLISHLKGLVIVLPLSGCLFVIITASLTSNLKKSGKILQFILAIFLILVLILGGFFILWFFFNLSRALSPHPYTEPFFSFELLTLICFVFSIPAFITGIVRFFLSNSKLSRIISLLITIVAFASFIYCGYSLGLKTTDKEFVIAGLLLEIPILLIIYFNRPEIKRLFT